MKIKLLLALCLSISSFSQIISQEDAYKTLIKRSAVCVHKAQKHMLAAKKNDLGGQLAKAVLFQSYAVKLYGQKKEALAACYSLEARKIAFTIIMNTSHREDAYSLPSEEEKKLPAGCADEKTAQNETKKALPELSEKDASYLDPKSLNFSNIDLK